jgi:outer membrane protein OmpA-like peptidoglycan-associated protein
VQRGAANTPKVTLLARPAAPQVRRTPKRLVLVRPIQFTADTAIIATESDIVLAEVAELLDKHPEIALVEVQGHLDDGGTRDDQLLSEQRAEAVRAWLIQAGVAESRLSSKGFGATRPLMPNITPQNRARNRRIELLIK